MQYKHTVGFASLLLSLAVVGCKDDVDARAREMLAARAKEEAQQKLLIDVTKLRADADARAKKDADEKLQTEANAKAQSAFAAQKEKIDKAKAEAELKEKNAAALEAEAKKKLAEAEANRNDLEARKIADKARADADFARRIAIAGEEENLRLRRELLLLEQKFAISGSPGVPPVTPGLLPVPGGQIPPGGKLVTRGPTGGSWVKSSTSGAKMFVPANGIPADTVFEIKDAPKLPVVAGPVPFCAVECLPSPFTFIPPMKARVEIPLPKFVNPPASIKVFRFDPARNEYVPWVPMKFAIVKTTGPKRGLVAEADLEHFTVVGLCFEEGAKPGIAGTAARPPQRSEGAPPALTDPNLPTEAPPEPLNPGRPEEAPPLPLDPNMPEEEAPPAPLDPASPEEAPPGPLDPVSPDLDHPDRKPAAPPPAAPRPESPRIGE